MAGIRPGDVVVAIDGRPAHLAGTSIPGNATTITYVGGDGRVHVANAAPLEAGLFVLLSLVAIGLAGLGAIVFRWSADAALGGSFLLFGGSFALALIAPPAARLGHQWASVASSTAAILATPSLAAVFLRFPRPLRGATRASRLQLAISLVLAGGAAYSDSSSTAYPQVLSSALSLWFVGNVALTCALVALRLSRPADRHSLAPVAVGVLVGVVPVTLLTVLPQAAERQALLPGEVTAGAAIAIPISFAFAILRHRLFALDAIVRRVLIRAVEVLGSIALFATSWYILRAVGLEPTTGAVVATAVAAGIAPLVHRGARRFVDAWLYSAAQRVEDQAASLDAEDRQGIGRTAAGLIRQAVPTAWAACVAFPHVDEQDPESLVFHGGDGDVPADVRNGADLASMLVGHPPSAGLPTAAAIERSGAKVGYLLVGPRIDGTPLSGTDLDVIQTVARSIAAPLEAALLRQHADEETRFREDLLLFAGELAAADSTDDVLDVARRHAAQLLHAADVAVWRRLANGHYSTASTVPPPGEPEAPTLSEILGRERARALEARGVVRTPGTADAEDAPTLVWALGKRTPFDALLIATREPRRRPFSAEDERRALEIASHAAVALRRATEREQSQAVLERLQRHQELILTSAGEGIVGFDAEGRVTFANPAALRYTGFDASELVGHEIDGLIPPTLADGSPVGREASPIYRTLREGTPRGGSDQELSGKDGRRFPVEYQAAPIYEEGRVVGAVLTFKDITHRRANERMKDEFVSMVSHELRTPLNGVIGLTDLLFATELSETQQGYADGIKRAGETLLSIINDILDFSKIEAGEMKLEDGELSVREVLEDVTELLREQATSKGLVLAAIVHRTVPTLLKGDGGHLRQILLNLVGNAVKFTESGEVVARARVEEDGAERVTLRFEVEDTGIGIPTDARDRLFRPFSQVDASMTRRYGGTGLGLTICKRMVEMMGGQIGVESEQGKGSMFWFTVVLGKAAAPAWEHEHPDSLVELPGSPEPIRAAHVLLVEDSPVSQQAAAGMLALMGHSVQVAENGRDAVDAYRLGRFDAVLMDCRMPEMDGFQATALIREHEQATRGPRTPIVAMTAHARRDDRQRCLAAGMDDYLAKPVRLQDLRETLARWLPSQATGAATRSSAPSSRPIERLTAARAAAVDVDGLFAEEVEKSLSSLRLALAQGNPEGVRAAGHRIAGDSAIAGHDDLCALGRKIEQLPDEQVPSDAARLADMLEAKLQRLGFDRAA